MGSLQLDMEPWPSWCSKVGPVRFCRIEALCRGEGYFWRFGYREGSCTHTAYKHFSLKVALTQGP